MKIHLFKALVLMLVIIQSINVSGQTVEEQNKKLKQEIEALKHDNDYFRKTLDIFTSSLKTTSSDNIDFQLIKCTGSKANQTVTLEFLLTNKDVNKDIQFSPDKYAKGIDLQGNAYGIGNIKIGTEVYRTEIIKDVPLKFTFQFKEVDPSVAIFKLISVEYFTSLSNYKNIRVTYKDVPVAWK